MAPLDDETRANLIDQTAELRWSVRNEGLRRLLRERGFDPERCIQVSLDQGDDVNRVIVLNDGTVVNLDYREHYLTRQAIRFTRWDVADYCDRDIQLARQIISGEDHDFDAEVRLYYEKEIAPRDKPLPPMKWGDRLWHKWETPPAS